MKQKGKPTITCEWISVDDVTEDKCKAESLEEFFKPENILALFEYRCNKLLQRSAMSLAGRMMAKEEDPFDIWNDEQVFGGQELALAYGEYTTVLFDTKFLSQIEKRETKDF